MKNLIALLTFSTLFLVSCETSVNESDNTFGGLPADFSAEGYLEANPQVGQSVVADSINRYNTLYLDSLMTLEFITLISYGPGNVADTFKVDDGAGNLVPWVVPGTGPVTDTITTYRERWLASGSEAEREAISSAIQAKYPKAAFFLKQFMQEVYPPSMSPYTLAVTQVKGYLDTILIKDSLQFIADMADPTRRFSELFQEFGGASDSVFQAQVGLRSFDKAFSGLFNFMNRTNDDELALAIEVDLQKVEDDYILAGKVMGRPYRVCESSEIKASALKPAGRDGDDFSDSFFCRDTSDWQIYEVE